METVLRGPTEEVRIGPGLPTVIIGERINPTGRKVFSAELQAGDLSRVPRDAQAQAEAGARVLDVNVGAASVDEVALLPRAVELAQQAVDLPVCIDSANPEALRAALAVAQGRALVNSVNGERAKLDAVLPVVADYGAAVIALVMDDSGIPETPEKRLRVAAAILEAAQQHGIAPQDVLLDPLVLAIGADHLAGAVTAETARLIRCELGCNMTAGASNASHGMPERELLNTVWLALLIQAGVNAPICNPLKNGLAVRAVDLMLGYDEWGMGYIQAYRAAQKAAAG
ncbi:MAG TPA: dihydropteroate synthase [Aggregatilineaceae bacterium]|nr:dihydropteroate synthase [Aggregatilineaceae bacterium]